jgi:hypothetical protein
MLTWVLLLYAVPQRICHWINTKEERKNVGHNSCPGACACGGMYTTNTMASSIETMAMGKNSIEFRSYMDHVSYLSCEHSTHLKASYSGNLKDRRRRAEEG